MGLYYTIPGADFSGEGLPNVRPALPRLGGKLYAAYLFGDAYSVNEGNAAQDISSQSRNANLNSAVVEDYAILALDSGYATTPFNTDALVGDDDAATIICVATIMAGGLSAALIGSGVTAPYISMTVEPTNNLVRAINNANGSNDNASISIAGNYGAPLALVTTHSPTAVQAHKRVAGGALQSSAVATTARVPGGAGVFRFGDFAGASAAAIHLHGAAFYRGVLTPTQISEVLNAFNIWFDAAGFQI